MIVTSLELEGQVPLLIVHRRIYDCPAVPVNKLVLLLTSLIAPSPSAVPPGAKLHWPVPITGSVPFRVVLVPQIVWLPPDTEVVGA